MRTLLIMILVVFLSTTIHAQVYLTAPYGPDGTYNLYELRGAANSSLARLIPSFSQDEPFDVAKEIAEQATETYTGNRVLGHVVRADDALEYQFLFDTGYTGFLEIADETSYQPGLGGIVATFPFAATMSQGRRVPHEQNYFIEYETHLPGPLPPFVGDLPTLVVPDQGMGGFNIREVQSTLPAGEIQFARNLDVAANVPEDAAVYEYNESVLNFAGLRSSSREFFEDDNRQFRSHDPAISHQDSVTLVANAQIHVTDENAGVWEFLVGSDDGFELLIRDEVFLHTTDIGGVVVPSLPSKVSPYGSLQFTGDRAFSGTIGAIELSEGTYELELLYWDSGGDAALELAARGPNDVDFELIGAQSSSLQIVPEPRASQLAWVCLFVFAFGRRAALSRYYS